MDVKHGVSIAELKIVYGKVAVREIADVLLWAVQESKDAGSQV
jgi:hypothetical protein